MRITIFSCDSTRAASSLLAQTTLSAPTRSPYSEKLFENEVDDEEVDAGGQELLHHGAVLGDAVAEALVGHVEEGHQAARLDRPATTCAHCAGVRSQPVGLWQQACSTTMVPAGAALQRGQHGVEAHAARGGVVVGVGVDLEAGVA